jgi:uncharacterized protein RhaS with RHS repeats
MLTHYRYRAYHPALRYFMQRDPLGYTDGPSMYQYVLGNPLLHVDPYGLDWKETTHDCLDWAGFIPGLGAFADASNAIFYLFEGNYWEAAAAGFSALPAVGDAFAAGRKVVRIAGKLEDLEDLGSLARKSKRVKKTSDKVPPPKVKGKGKIDGKVPDSVPKNWDKETIEDAITDYEHSIRVRKQELEKFDKLKGGGHRWTRKSHTERIAEEEKFLRQLRKRLEDMP